jgi:hypothetical protein
MNLVPPSSAPPPAILLGRRPRFISVCLTGSVVRARRFGKKKDPRFSEGSFRDFPFIPLFKSVTPR